MTEEAKLEVVFEAESAVVDVVFVHGLTGDAEETWSNGDADGYWPGWLCKELQGVSVYSLGYPASAVERRKRREMDMFERAGNVLERFAARGVGRRPIAFVAHSLGGLLTKIVLRKSWEATEEAWRQVSESTRLVFFIATPHAGAALASFAEVVPFTSKHIKLLANQDGFLGDLNDQYRTFANDREDLTTVAYYEKHTTNGVLVVSKESADPGVAGATPIAVDKDHTHICKPLDAEDMVFLGVKRRVQRLAQFVSGSSATVARPARAPQVFAGLCHAGEIIRVRRVVGNRWSCM